MVRVLRLAWHRWGDLEADLQRFYGLDARDCWRDGGDPRLIGLRRLGSLVARLPEEARCWRVDGDDDPTAWTTSVELLAQAVDKLALLASEYRTKGEPLFVPRPERPGPRSSKASSPEEIRSFFTGRVR